MAQIEKLTGEMTEIIDAAAQLLLLAFQELAPQAWPDIEAARAEVVESLAGDRISLFARQDGVVAGWIGAICGYDGHAWELHPLAVHPTYQRQGIGRALVARLEREVRARDGLTLYLGTDDEVGLTSLSATELYPDVLEHARRLRNLYDDERRHPFSFYQRLGYRVVGVIPDANGWGKPDIIMAKRVGRLPQQR